MVVADRQPLARIPLTPHAATLRYDAALVREAVFGFWWRSIQRRTFVAWAVCAVLLAYLRSTGDRSWLVDALGVVLVASAFIIAAVYGVHHRGAMRRLAAMGEPTATFHAARDDFTVTSGAGTTTLPWSSIKEIWQLERCWLLLLSRAQFMTLPLDGIGMPMREHIVARVTAAGGKVSR